MAHPQNRDKDDTLELQVPADSPLSLSGCGSIAPEPTRLDRIDACRPRSDLHTPPPTQERKRTATHQPDTAKRPVNRCSGCRKRVGLTGFRCRCGDLFCSHHRYSDRHECSYDYKTAGREAIARENPVVRAAKILKV